jgi:hypothetical protein
MTAFMAPDYRSSAGRHLEDALLLFDVARFDNAGYLSGYVIECSLKLLIEASGTRPKQYQHELVTLSGNALLLACIMVPGIRRYSIPRSPDFQSMTNAWGPDLRYHTSGTTTRAQAETWLRVAADAYRSIVVESILDGWSGP